MKYNFENEKVLKNIIYIADGNYNDLCPLEIESLEIDKQVLKDKYLKNEKLSSSLKNLKSPESLIDINFISPSSQLSYSLFYKTDLFISLQYSKDEIQLSNPSNVKDIFDGLKSFNGYSPIKSLDLELKLNLEETILLITSIDLQRRDNFIKLSNNKNFKKINLNFEKILEFIRQKDFSQNDLLYYFEKLISINEINKKNLKLQLIII